MTFCGFRHLLRRLDRFQIGLRGLHLRHRRIVARDGLVVDGLGTVARVLRPDFILEHLGLHVQFALGVLDLGVGADQSGLLVGDVQFGVGDVQIRFLDANLRIRNLCLGAVQIGLGLVHPGLERSRIDLGDQLALLNHGIVIRIQPGDIAGYLAAHRHGNHGRERACSGNGRFEIATLHFGRQEICFFRAIVIGEAAQG